MKPSLDLWCHGFAVRVESDDEAFLAFVRSHYACFVAERRRDVHLRVCFAPEASVAAHAIRDSIPRLGEGLHVDGRRLFWENEFGFALLAEFVAADQWNLSGYHDDLLRAQTDEDRRKNYTRSMRWLIHFPLFCLMERMKGIRLVHASAISKDGQALVFAGLNKVGKSSLARYLYEHHGYRYVSDNFLLTNGNRLYAFPERARLPEALFEHIPSNAEHKDIVYGKRHVPIAPEKVEMEAAPLAVFIIGNHAERSMTPIPREEALRWLDSIHRFLQEFPEYTFYSFLEAAGQWAPSSIALFPGHTRFFRLNIPLDWSLQAGAEQVLSCISTT